ncbi:MAG TPA: nuclear transport factor 2 family protein [Candidatus Limnocylindrales bacterium]
MGQARNAMDKLTKAATEAHDIDAVMSMYSDNAVLSTPDVGDLKDRAEIAGYWKQFIDGFPDGKFQYANRIEAGNTAVDEGWFEGTNTKAVKLPSGETMPATGKHVRLRSCDIATVENGKITEHHLYFDELDFQRQMGLAPAS